MRPAKRSVLSLELNVQQHVKCWGGGGGADFRSALNNERRPEETLDSLSHPEGLEVRKRGSCRTDWVAAEAQIVTFHRPHLQKDRERVDF